MKHTSTILLFIAMAFATTARAYDFSATIQTGQTLYFATVTGGVEVVFPATTPQPTLGWVGYNKPSGAMTIPDSVEHNGQRYAIVAIRNHAFYGCDGLTQVVIQNGPRAIRANAFNQCTSLQYITLPASVDTLAASAIANCTALQQLHIMRQQPPYTTTATFTGTNLSQAELRVPCQCTENYTATQPWSTFGNITDDGCAATLSVTANHAQRGTVTGTGTYAAGTVAVASATAAEGYFFACWDDGDTLNPRTLTLQHNTSLTAMFFALQHDTVYAQLQHDTLYLHDTVRMVVVTTDTLVQRDTVRMLVTHVDTLFVVQHDTVTQFLQGTDTLFITTTDTIYSLHTDTITQYIAADTIRDTIYPTFFRLTVLSEQGGTGIGSAILPAGTEAEIGALPDEGYRFTHWDNGLTANPCKITVAANTTLTAHFAPVDNTGIDVVPMWAMNICGLDLTLYDLAGHTVRIYSSDGRLLHTAHPTSATLRLRLPASGVYLVQPNGFAARRVVATE